MLILRVILRVYMYTLYTDWYSLFALHTLDCDALLLFPDVERAAAATTTLANFSVIYNFFCSTIIIVLVVDMYTSSSVRAYLALDHLLEHTTMYRTMSV